MTANQLSRSHGAVDRRIRLQKPTDSVSNTGYGESIAYGGFQCERRVSVLSISLQTSLSGQSLGIGLPTHVEPRAHAGCGR